MKYTSFQCMDKIFCVEFQRIPLKFHTKYLTHTLKDMIFIEYWNPPPPPPLNTKAISCHVKTLNTRIIILVAQSALSHYLNQCWNIVNLALRKEIHWNNYENSYIFVLENAFQKAVWKMATILSRPQCAKHVCKVHKWKYLCKIYSSKIFYRIYSFKIIKLKL